MSEEIKEYTFEKTFDVKFDESALKTFNDLIKEKGIRHFKLESDLYGVLDVVSYEEYEKLQQKVEQLEKELEQKEAILGGIQQLEHKCEQLESIRKEATELIKKYQRKDEFLNLNEWQTRDLLNILNKGSDKE